MNHFQKGFFLLRAKEEDGVINYNILFMTEGNG